VSARPAVADTKEFAHEDEGAALSRSLPPHARRNQSPAAPPFA
jgi:hypothetical protein